MPRITKRQKEAGVQPKPKPKGRSINPKAGPGGERKKGFHVGPAHARRDAYLGKAKKIKAELITRAKMKKSYAKVLKQEGMVSERLKPGTSDTAEGGSSVDGAEEEQEDPEKAGESSRSGEGGRKHLDMGTRMGLQSGDLPNRSLGRKGKGRAPFSRGEDRELRDTNPRRKFRPTAPTASGTTRALSPSDIGPPLPISSLRTLKKEAFAKYHSPRRLTDAVGEAGRKGSGGGSGAKGRGQPNMGARMGALLEKIKRDRTG